MTGNTMMGNPRVVILGAKGMLGSDLAAVCSKCGIDSVGLDLPEFDITSEEHIQEAVKGADAVVNCAAYTNVEKAESEPELANTVNGKAVGMLGAIAKENGIWVLHISTDFVFDGQSDRPYVETDKPNPISTYGKSKLTGEQLLIESGCSNCILRIEWTYGSNGNNFVTKLVSAAKQGKQLNVVDDQIGSPTATTEVADVICQLLDKKPEGIFHFASAGYISRFDMAKFIFDKLDIAVDLRPCKTADYVTAAKRPLNSRFDCGKIKALLAEPIKPWQESLEVFLRKL